jgi:hypothetical protein
MSNPTTFSSLPHLSFIGKLHLLRTTSTPFYLEDLYAEYVNFLLTNGLSPTEIAGFIVLVGELTTKKALVEIGRGVVKFSEESARVKGLMGEEEVREVST